MKPQIRSTGRLGDLAYKATYHCPTCKRAAIAYSEQPNATWYGMCPLDHNSLLDTTGREPIIVELPSG